MPMTWLAWTIETFGAARRRWPRMTVASPTRIDLVLGMRPGVVEAPGDDLRRAVVAAHGIDRDADAAAGTAGRDTVEGRPVTASAAAVVARG